jgi:hypothetical protein
VPNHEYIQHDCAAVAALTLAALTEFRKQQSQSGVTQTISSTMRCVTLIVLLCVASLQLAAAQSASGKLSGNSTSGITCSTGEGGWG